MWKLAAAWGLSLAVGCTAEEVETLTVELGTNVAGAFSPEAYAPLMDEARVVLGHQGLHMVVLAARLPAPRGEALTVEAALTVEPGLEARVRLARRPQPGPDGASYLLNLFVVLDDPEHWVGQTARVTVRVEAAGGTRGQATGTVVLREETAWQED